NDRAEATPGLRRGALPADGAAQDRAVRTTLDQRGGPRLQAAQEPARGGDDLRPAGRDPVLADRGEHVEFGADPPEPDRHDRPPRTEAADLLDQRRDSDGRGPNATGDLLGLEHHPQSALELHDDRDSGEPQTAAPLSGGLR